MSIKPPLVASQPAVGLLPQPIGYLEVGGHSGAAEANGLTLPDFGFIHKVDAFLQPALVANIAMGSAVLSWHNQGNGVTGDGGWAHWATEFDRQEQSSGIGAQLWGATTLSAVMSSTGLTSLSATLRDNFYPGEYIVLGAGANTEVVQVSIGYTAATGAGTIAITTTTETHASGDPVYHAPLNEGYLPKSQMSILDYGMPDAAANFPQNPTGTFGTTPGATRGYVPYKHALRSTIAMARCSVIYKDTHPSCIYGGTWTSTPGTSTASYPQIGWFGGGNAGNFHSATVNGATIQFSTEPHFPGGTAVAFFASNNLGNGANWTTTVNGSASSTLDTRNVNAVLMNDAVGLPTGKTTLCCIRFTGLAAGVNTIICTAATIQTAAPFFGWGVEPLNPTSVVVPLGWRVRDPTSDQPLLGFGSLNQAQYGYWRRSPTTGQTATVTAAAGTASGSVTLGSAVLIGTTATDKTAVYPGDTITIGASTSQETRRIVAVDSTTTLHVDANFVSTHTGEVCQIGLQNADFVGGGYLNRADTQGLTSCPGINTYTRQVIAEFTDNLVRAFDLDDALSGGPGFPIDPTVISGDGTHPNEKGAGLGASALSQMILAYQRSPKLTAAPTINNKRKYLPVWPASATGRPCFFVNSWADLFPSISLFPRSGYYKDFRTREVEVIIAAQLGSDSTICTLPAGCRPSKMAFLPGYGNNGPAMLLVAPTGAISFAYGYGVPSGTYAICRGIFLAEQ